MNKFLALISTLSYFYIVRNWKLARLLKDFNIPVNEISKKSKTKAPYLKPLNLELKGHTQRFIIEGYNYLKEFCEDGMKLSYNRDGQVIGQIGELKIRFTNKQEIYIAKEIFLDKEYSFTSKSNVSIIDIGFNVGMASLFFAEMPNVTKVFAFEPIAPTRKKGQFNLDLNPRHSRKIELFNYGLGENNDILDVIYDEEKAGNVSAFNGKIKKGRIEKLELRKCDVELDKILAKTESELVIKMDCEGCEYGIIKSLANSKILNKMKGILMEYHNGAPDELKNVLVESGFSVKMYGQKGQLGYISAWNTRD